MASIIPIARAPLLHASVQESVRAFIVENALQAGDQLPHEGELARRLQVSRNSVREALKGLESVGIIEIRRGIGIFVRPFSFGPLLANMAFGLREAFRDVDDILEVRRILEGAMIAKTVERIPEEDLAELGRIMQRMKAKAEVNENLSLEDQHFHRVLFRCLDNKVLLQLTDLFWEVFFRASNFTNLQDPNPLATWKAHNDIFEAVSARDVASARTLLDRHYDGSFRRHLAYQKARDFRAERAFSEVVPAAPGAARAPKKSRRRGRS